MPSPLVPLCIVVQVQFSSGVLARWPVPGVRVQWVPCGGQSCHFCFGGLARYVALGLLFVVVPHLHPLSQPCRRPWGRGRCMVLAVVCG